MSDPEVNIKIKATDEASSTFSKVSDAVDNTTKKTEALGLSNVKSAGSTKDLVVGLSGLATSAWSLTQGWDDLQDGQVGVNRAMVAAKSSANSAEDAQTRYNAVVAKYGPASDQATSALKDLQLAQERSTVAQERADLVQDNLQEKYVTFGLSVIPAAITGLASLGKVTENLGAITKITTGLTEGLGKVFSFLAAHPILIVIGLLAAAFIWAYENVEPFRNAVDALAKRLSGALAPIIDRITGSLTWLGNVLDTVTGQAKGVSGATEDVATGLNSAGLEAEYAKNRAKELEGAYDSLKPKVDAVASAQDALADKQGLARVAAQALQLAQDNLAMVLEYVTGKVSTYTAKTDDAAWASGAAKIEYGKLKSELDILTGSVDQASGALGELQGQLNSTQYQSNVLRLEQMKLRDAFEDGRISESEYEAQNETLEGKMRDLDIASAELNLKITDQKTALDSAKTAADDAKTKLDLLKTANDNAVTAAAANKTAQENLTTAQDKLATAVNALRTALEEAVTKLGLTQTELEKLKGKLDPATTSANGLEAAINGIPSSKTITVLTQYTSSGTPNVDLTNTQTAMAAAAAAKIVPLPSEGTTASGRLIDLTKPTSYVTASGRLIDYAAASGFEGVVSKPTAFLAGEAGPEYVSVTPGGASGGRSTTINNTVNLTIQGSADEKTARLASELILRQLRKY